MEQNQRLAVLTCSCAALRGRPIARVTRDTDGDWQLLCGGSHGAEDAMVVSLGQMCALDASVLETAGLGPGQTATRTSPRDRWRMPEG